MKVMTMTTSKIIRTYSELMKLPTFEERYRYLKLSGNVGMETFGFDRYLNQQFYNNSEEYLAIRNKVIVRDEGCDLADPDHPINGRIIIHHMNPITEADILQRNPDIINPEYLICVSHKTHNAIHYGKNDYVAESFAIRRPNDMIPWKH